ncbi:MAG: SBBP repeat-containing protein [Acidobacteriota bacterium]
MGTFPMTFEANVGQVDTRVLYLAKGGGYTLFLTPDEAVFAFAASPNAEGVGRPGPERTRSAPQPCVSVIRLSFPGANPAPRVEGIEQIPYRTNYFRGADPRRWYRGVPHYASVALRDVYPGIDVVFHAGQPLEFDFLLASHANASNLTVSLEGATAGRLDPDGDLLAMTPAGVLTLHCPRAFQETDGRRQEVPVRFAHPEPECGNRMTAALNVDAHDASLPLLVDPSLTYSTYLGGSSLEDIYSIHVDPSGFLYLAGMTYSVDFPTSGPIQGNNAGTWDAWVAKLDPVNNALLYSTYLGGTGADYSQELDVSPAGDTIVVGHTSSSDFPLKNALQPTFGGNIDAFVAKIDAGGSTLVFSTFLGGSDWDFGTSIVRDTSGNIYLGGTTKSTDFPTAGPYQPQNSGGEDLFFAKMDPAASTLLASTYFGGSGEDVMEDMEMDPTGACIGVGWTMSPDFPVINPLQPRNYADGVVVRIASDLASASFSTTLGGTDSDEAEGLAIDPTGLIYVAGLTHSIDFPVVNAYQAANRGGDDAFLCKIDPNTPTLLYSTFLGGTQGDIAYAIDVDAGGTCYVSGTTISSDFPLMLPFQTAFVGSECFVASIPTSTSTLNYSSFLGGSLGEASFASALDGSGNLWLAGSTSSVDFPMVSPFQGSYQGGTSEGFVARIGPCPTITLAPPTLPGGTVGVPYSQTVSAAGGTPPYSFGLTAGALPVGTSLQTSGAISGTPTLAATYGFTVTVTDGAGCTASIAYALTIAGSGGSSENIVLGEGLGQPNANRVKVYRQDGTPTIVDFVAYSAGQWGVNVAGANASGASLEQILSGPGPGPTLGPQLRGFTATGTAMPKINFYAYGTLRYGVNPSRAEVDLDGYDEIVTGAGPGAVFGPHVRGWGYDNTSIMALAKVSFFAYSTLRYGVNASSGNLDSDAFDELVTGAGPGIIFAPQVRGFNYDNSTVTSIAKVNFNAFAVLQFGANVAADDVDSDSFSEIACAQGPGPGPSFAPRFLGFDYDGSAVAALPGFDVTTNASRSYGGRIGLGDVTGDARSDLLAGEGRDPASDAIVRPYCYSANNLVPLLSFNPFVGQKYGVNLTGGDLGY